MSIPELGSILLLVILILIPVGLIGGVFWLDRKLKNIDIPFYAAKAQAKRVDVPMNGEALFDEEEKIILGEALEDKKPKD